MPAWTWSVVGLVAGAGLPLVVETRLRGWCARRLWQLSLGLFIVCLVLPFGIVLVLFLSDSAFDGVRELGKFLAGDEFGWVTGLALGWLAGSGLTAWAYRHAPRLQGPPPSERVAALASDPETLARAVQEYRRETGTGLPEALDVLESHRPDRRSRPPAEAMDWMYAGFAAAWYVLLAAGFVLTLPSQSNHFLTGLALFLFIPALFSGFCGVCGGVVSARAKDALRTAFRAGVLSRRYAFAAGLAAGVVSVAGVAAVGSYAYSLNPSEFGVLVTLFAVAGVLGASLFLGLWLMRKRCAAGPGR